MWFPLIAIAFVFVLDLVILYFLAVRCRWYAIVCKSSSDVGKSRLITVNDDQKDATILANLFIHNQLYIFRAISSPIIRSTWLYLQHLILSTGIAAGWCYG